MPGSAGDQDGIARLNSLSFSIDLHDPVAFKNEVEFLAQFVVVTLGRLTDRDGGLSEGVVLDGCIGAIQDAADGTAVLRGEVNLLGKLVDRHG